MYDVAEQTNRMYAAGYLDAFDLDGEWDTYAAMLSEDYKRGYSDGADVVYYLIYKGQP